MSYEPHNHQPDEPPHSSHRQYAATRADSDVAEPPPDPIHHAAPSRSRRSWWIAAGIAVALAIIGITTGVALVSSGGGGVGAVVPVDQTTALEDARATCAPGDPDISLGDEGHSMTITGAGHYTGADIEDAACVLTQLGIPDSVVARIDRTRALDGMQEAEWDDFTAVWTYHPDDGLNLIIEES